MLRVVWHRFVRAAYSPVPLLHMFWWLNQPCKTLSYLIFMQDVWTELGRPCGIHQKQVVLYFFGVLTENWYIQLLLSSFKFLHVRLLVGIDFISYAGWSNGDSFCVRSPAEDNSLWWLLLQLLYSWLRYTVWWAGMSSSEFPWAHLMKSISVLRLLWFICRHIKSRNLSCTPTILCMLILIHTWSAILLSIVLIVSWFFMIYSALSLYQFKRIGYSF